MGDGNGDLTVGGRDAGPIALGEALRFPDFGRHIERVVAVDLAQPSVLRAPAVIHGHWPLRQGVDRKAFVLIRAGVPDRQRVHTVLDALAQVFGGLPLSVTFGGQLEFAHRLTPEGKDVGLWLVVERHLDRPVLIGLVPRFIELRVLGHVRQIEPTVVDVVLHLVWVDLTTASLGAIFTTEPDKGPDTWTALVVDDVVGVIFILCGAVVIHKAGQLHFGAQLDQRGLEAAHIAVRLNHGPADRIRRALRLTDRAIEG